MEQTKSALLASALELEYSLHDAGLAPISDVPVHFRFVPHEQPENIIKHLLNHNIIVRQKTNAEGISGFRIVAPDANYMPKIRSALKTLSY